MEDVLVKVVDQMQELQKIMLAILQKGTSYNFLTEGAEGKQEPNTSLNLPSFPEFNLLGGEDWNSYIKSTFRSTYIKK